MGLGKMIMGHGMYSSGIMVGVRNYPASGGRDGMWGGEEWTERRIIMNRMKNTQKFLEREIRVRNDKSENWENWENWGSRCQLEEVDISGNLHLAKMG